MFKTRFFVSLVIAATFVLSLGRAEPIEVDTSTVHFPVIYVSTSGTEAHFNALMPRLKNYVFRAVPIGVRGAKPIYGEILGAPIQDNQKLLHQHALKVKITGLEPGTQYKLEILEKNQFGETLADTRLFSSFDNKPQSLKFVTGSCMSDETRYENVRQKIVANLLRQNPDVILLSGDEVYVDSFDYVERHKATEFDVWARYFSSFSVNPLFRSKTLIPTIATWDDHDVGVDNGNKTTPTIADARRAFVALFGAPEIAGVSENGSPDGVNRIVTVRGQNFVMLDNRSFRAAGHDTAESSDRYGHIGQEQEEWLAKQIQTKKGFFWLVVGDMWGSEVVTDEHDGKVKRLTEGFHADHPKQYEAVMKMLHDANVPFALVSGDIHFTQFIEHGPQHKGTPRHAPFETLEITSSAMFSFIFPPKAGEPVLWPDPHRIVGVKDYNFVVVDSNLLPKGLDIKAVSIGQEGTPFFKVGKRIETEKSYESNRRKFLIDPKTIPAQSKKVKVAFFDADSTLRIAKSGSISANGPEDVIILPGVADMIAQKIKEGFLIAIVSNQNGVSAEHIAMSGDSTFEGKFIIADKGLQYTITSIEKENAEAKIHYYDFAEGDKDDYYNKPQIGMGEHIIRALAAEGYAFDRENSIMVGDSDYKAPNPYKGEPGEIGPDGVMGDAGSNADLGFAVNMKIKHVHPQALTGWSKKVRAAIVAHDPKKLEDAIHCEKQLRP